MFKGMKTTLLVVTGLTVGYFGTMLAGCGSAPGHTVEETCCIDTTKVDSVAVVETVVETAIVDPATIPATITEGNEAE